MHPTWTQSDLEINGASIHFYRTGDGSKPPLLLAHGFSDNGLCWQPVTEELQGRYDVIMPEARGHGFSARIRPGERLDMPADLACLIGTLGLKDVIVGGHSMGASVAFQLAARFPRLVRALFLEDPPWGFRPPTPPAAGPLEHPLSEFARGLQTKTLEQLMDECRQEHPTWPEITVQRWCEGKKQLDPGFLSTLGSMSNGWQEQLKQIRCPALLITADPALGGIITPEIARLVVEANPSFQVANIPGVGHHVRFADHALYMKKVNEFLDND